MITSKLQTERQKSEWVKQNSVRWNPSSSSLHELKIRTVKARPHTRIICMNNEKSSKFMSSRANTGCVFMKLYILGALSSKHLRNMSIVVSDSFLCADWLNSNWNNEEWTNGSSSLAINSYGSASGKKLSQYLLEQELLLHRGHKDNGESRATKQNDCDAILFEDRLKTILDYSLPIVSDWTNLWIGFVSFLNFPSLVRVCGRYHE